jgi:hypothetical protein
MHSEMFQELKKLQSEKLRKQKKRSRTGESSGPITTDGQDEMHSTPLRGPLRMCRRQITGAERNAMLRSSYPEPQQERG